MSKLEKVFEKIATAQDNERKTLEKLQKLFQNVKKVDAIFKTKQLYKNEAQIVITVVKLSNTSKQFEEIYCAHFWTKFPSVAKNYGDIVAFLGPKTQFSQEELDVLKTFNLTVVEINTKPSIGGPN